MEKGTTMKQQKLKKVTIFMKNNGYQTPKDEKIQYFLGRKLKQSNTFN